MRRLREALVKSVALLGVCKPLQAACALSAAEAPEDKDYTVSRAAWRSDMDAAHARGRAFYGRLYGRHAADTAGLLAGHGDFDVVCEHVVYGFLLGDRQAVGADLQVEVVVLAAVMAQDLARETGWHLRGIRRLWGLAGGRAGRLGLRSIGGLALWAGAGSGSDGGGGGVGGVREKGGGDREEQEEGDSDQSGHIMPVVAVTQTKSIKYSYKMPELPNISPHLLNVFESNRERKRTFEK